MKKVLLLTFEYPPDRGGIATYLFNLHNNLDNIEIKRVQTWIFWPMWLPMIWQSIIITIKKKIDILAISHVLPAGYAALVLKKLFGREYIVFVHGLDLISASNNSWKIFWLRRVLENARDVIANSNFTKSLTLKFGAKDVKIITPCITNIAELNLVKTNDSLLTLLSVGRLVKRKNHLMVLNILSRLKKKFPNIKYNIVGNGPEKGTLEKQISALGLDEIVKIYSNVGDDERLDFYKSADLFIMPAVSDENDVEGFGIVYLEAASFGLPVVAGLGGGVSEAVVNNETGFLIDPQNSNELYNAIEKLLLDYELRKKMGENGYKRVVEEFRCGAKRAQLLKIYES